MKAEIAQFANRGMNQDISVSKATNEFAFRNYNIRITAVNDNTLLSVTNEKLPKSVDITGGVVNNYIQGKYLGHAILNDKLVLFTVNDKSNIVVLEYKNDIFNIISSYSGNLGFSQDWPIETLAYYESDDIQKVYWVDGYNQPRVVNIAKEFKQNDDYQFDFSPVVNSLPNANIIRQHKGIGLFPSGVIQYFISYYNKYGAETGIVWSSELYNVSNVDRGGAPDENIICNFNIKVVNVDTSYEYMRVYSMQRTSLNATPICRLVANTSINNSNTITVVDTNTNTEIIDPTELMFLGGDSFIASTITQKDDTLFLGDITVENYTVPTDLVDLLTPKEGVESEFLTITNYARSANDNRTFKANEWYRIAIQFQDNRLKWTAPIWVGDIKCTSEESNYLPSIVFDIKAFLDKPTAAELLKDYTHFRLLMAETSASTRDILAQGVVVPTVFNLEQRVNKTGPYAIGSWITRPNLGKANYEHLSPLGNSKVGDTYSNLPTCEIQNSINKFPIIENTTSNYLLSFYVIGADNHIRASVYEVKDGYAGTDLSSFDTANIKYLKDSEDLLKDYTPLNSEENYNILINWFSKYTSEINLDYSEYKAYIDDINSFTSNTKINTSGWYSAFIRVDIDGNFNLTTNTPTGSAPTYGAFTIVKVDTPKELALDEYSNSWYVDSSIVTFHSPDIKEGDSSFNSNLKFRIVGIAPIDSYYNDVFLSTKTSSIKPDGGLIKSNRNSSEYLLNAPLYQDYAWKNEEVDKTTAYNYYTYLWNKKGSITGQLSGYSYKVKGDSVEYDVINADLERKVIANKTISKYTRLLDNELSYSVYPVLYSSNEQQVVNIDNYNGDSVTYQGNYETLAVNSNNTKYKVFWESIRNGTIGYEDNQIDPVHIKYSKTPHLVFSLKHNNLPAILPALMASEDYDPNDIWSLKDIYGVEKESGAQYPWFDSPIDYTQQPIKALQITPYLFIGEVYKGANSKDLYGEPTQNNLERHNWIPISTALGINDETIHRQLYITRGDTYYQNWEYINTYPTTEEDTNSIIDIVSVKVETHVNLDGRYDKNKDSLNILNFRPTNFNKINDVYSQTNNYFTYSILDEKFNTSKYANQVVFSLQKTPTSEIDTWCNVTLSSAFNLNGLYGKLNKLSTVNDTIIAFQDKALSVINFNNRTALTTESGVPIEIANSGKVDGYTVLSSTVGCGNKWSICNTSSGVYFIDDNTKTMYSFSKEGISNISSKGMQQWFKNNLTGSERLYYDSITHDVYVTNKEFCLLYNEDLQQFSSFMDYYNTPLLFNIKENTFFAKEGGAGSTLYKMFAGDYTSNYSIEYKINPEPLVNKVFTNIEYIADCFNANDVIDGEPNISNVSSDLPFTNIKVWNEYQVGSTDLTIKYKYPNFTKKFRAWRVDVPRCGRDRISNPWMYLKLSKDSKDKCKMVFHNLLVKYYK